MTTVIADKPDNSGKDERRLKKVMINLMREPQFALFSGVMMCGTTAIKDGVASAATDGYNIYFGRAFLRSLDEKMIGFVILHETMHKAFRHLSIYRKLFEIDHSCANMAADYVINLMLVNLDPQSKFITFPVINGQRAGLLDHKYAGMNTKQIFDLLREEKKQKQKQKQKPNKGDQGEGGDEGDGVPDENTDEGDGDNPGGFDEHLWGDAKDVPKDVQETQAKEIDRALRQGQAAAAKLAGSGSLGNNKALDELLNPEVPWEELLREFIQSTCMNKDTSSWRRVNRRLIGQDLYMPSLIGESMRHMVIGVDASGSTWVGKVLTKFLTEAHAAITFANPDLLHLIYWDTSVTGVEEYDSTTLGTMVKSTQIKGGGGTNVSCLEDYLKEKRIRPECIIILTDGHLGGQWGQTWDGVPVLWVVAGNANATAPNGKTVHINEE